MTAIIGVAPVAPVLASASVRAEQVTQLVLGETAEHIDDSGEWLRIRTHLDRYEGWVHRGYVRVVADVEAAAWRKRAGAWSEGATIGAGDDMLSVPLRGRVALDGEEVALPDGRTGTLAAGALRPMAEASAANSAAPPEGWALHHFPGSPYQWGGLTPWGVDCSGLVQTTFLARGTVVPRDSSAQAHFGEAVSLDAFAPGDLLFFRSESGSDVITHVAFAAPGECIVHSTIACGGMVHEPFTAGSRAGDALRPRLAAARRYAAR
ncbi:MAG: C40 family peptidase [Gemmatimonadales bacterium]|nr:C40 family peptidase [Gemmatimonadales bacterium]